MLIKNLSKVFYMIMKEIQVAISNLPIKQEKQRKKKLDINIYEMIKEQARRFCLQTGLHGFQYIARPENTPTERFTWTFLSFGALLIALILSSLCWIQSSMQPTLIYTDSMHEPIYNNLFPGVAVCNINKISKLKAINFLRERLEINITEENEANWLEKITILSQMFFANEAKLDSRVVQELHHKFHRHNITAENALLQITPNCMEMLRNCKWKGKQIRCDRMFEITRTPEGICCTFNNFFLKNRIFEGYMARRYDNVPKRISACGHKSGLKALVKNNPDDYLSSELSSYGIKVLIYEPYNYPDWGAHKMIVGIGQLMHIALHPVKSYATKNIRHMNIKTRKCVFKDEKQLNIFTNYSYENCITECRIKILENICGCMPLYFLNEWAPWPTPLRICNLKDLICIGINKERIMSSVPGYDNYKTKFSNHKWGTEVDDCQCLPDCEFYSYNILKSATILSSNEFGSNKHFYNIKNAENHTSVSVFFKDINTLRRRRDVTHTWPQIFGLFGGLLGICLGFTIITVEDVFYSFTLRLRTDIIKQKKKKNKIGSISNNLPTIYDPIQIKSRKLQFNNDLWFIN